MKRLATALSVLVVAVGGLILADLTFWTRFMTIGDQTAVSHPSWISPTVTVVGNFDRPLPVTAAPLLSEGAMEALDAYAVRMRSFSLLVYHAGEIQLERYWQGFGPDDVTETYSMAKSMAGLMVGFAVEDGLIESLDDPVNRYVPEWTGPQKDTVTVRHLLQMSGGIEHFPFNFSPWQNPYSKALGLFIGSDMEAALMRFDVIETPGTVFNYNSANTQMLAVILSRVLEQSYAAYVSEKLWQPLGAKPATLWLDREGGMPKVYSFFQARPRDWLRVGLAMKNDGKYNGTPVIPASWLAQMREPSATNAKYGLHLWLGSPHEPTRFYNRNTPFGIPQSEPFLADDVVFFDGGGGQRVYVIPSADVVIVRTGFPAFDWDDGVIPNIVLRDLAARATAP